jgi:hypothetical protein
MDAIHDACQIYFDQYSLEYGEPPRRNHMMRAAELAALPPFTIRRNWEVLMGKRPRPRAAPPQERPLPPPAADHGREAPAPGEEPRQGPGLAASLAQQRVESHAMQAELRELRALVMTLAPRPNGPTPDLGEMVQHLGKMAAGLALLRQQVQTLADQQTRLTETVHALREAVEPLEALRTLLRTDAVAADTLKSMIRVHDSWTTDKKIYNWLASWVGWPLKPPQM